MPDPAAIWYCQQRRRRSDAVILRWSPAVHRAAV